MATFATIDEIEEFLQITIPAAKVAAVERALAEATAAIQHYCHQELFLHAGDVITLDVAAAQTKIFLPELLVISVSQVVENGDLLVVTDDYKLGQWGILHRVANYWSEGIQTVEITYTHGYGSDYSDLPADLVGVCTRAAARAYQAGLLAEESGGIPGLAGKSLGDYSVTYQQTAATEGTMGASAARVLLLSEKEILNHYRYVRQ